MHNQSCSVDITKTKNKTPSINGCWQFLILDQGYATHAAPLSTPQHFFVFCVRARFWSLLSFRTRHIRAQSERIAKERKGEEEDQNQKERGITNWLPFVLFMQMPPRFRRFLSLGGVGWQKQHVAAKDLIIILEISPRNKINPQQWLPSLKELSRLRCLPPLYSFVFPILYRVNMTTQHTQTHAHSCPGIVSVGRHTRLRRR